MLRSIVLVDMDWVEDMVGYGGSRGGCGVNGWSEAIGVLGRWGASSARTDHSGESAVCPVGAQASSSLSCVE